MSDHKLSFIFFEIGMILCVVAMVLGPVGIEIWSVACSAVAIFLACVGLYLAFCSWSEPAGKKPALQPQTKAAFDDASKEANAPSVERAVLEKPAEESLPTDTWEETPPDGGEPHAAGAEAAPENEPPKPKEPSA